jgi:hypothetical protein
MEQILYVLAFTISVVVASYGWRGSYGDGGREFCAIVGTSIAIILLIFSFPSIWNNGFEYTDATSTKLGSEIIVQAPGIPTQLVTDIKFIDQPLVIRKSKSVNLYGMGESYSYTVEIKKLEQ